MQWIKHVAASAPEIFLFVAIAIGILLGRIRVHGFSAGPNVVLTVLGPIIVGLTFIDRGDGDAFS